MSEVEFTPGRYYELRIPEIPQWQNVAIGLSGPHRIAHRAPIMTAWEFRPSDYMPPGESQMSTESM